MPRITRRGFMTGTLATTIAAGLTNGSAMASPATPVASPLASPIVKSDPKLDDAILTALQRVGAPGASVYTVSSDGSAYASAVGYADLRTNTPVTPEHHFRIGSITKSFTATRFMMLVDEGKVRLDDTLAKMLPDYAFLPNADAITMKHLLSMRSGLPEYTESEGFLSAWTTDPSQPFTTDQQMEYIKGAKAQFAPDTDFQYANTNYVLIGEVIAQLTGQTVRNAVLNDVITKAGLHNTTWPTTALMASPFARGYMYPSGAQAIAEAAGTPMSATPVPMASPAADTDPNEPVDVTVINPTAAGAAGAIVSTASDITQWLQTLLSGSLLSPESLKAMTTFQDAGNNMGYGFGLFNMQGMIGHNGMIDGFQSLMIHVPATKATVSILVNAGPTRTGEDPTFAILQAIAQ